GTREIGTAGRFRDGLFAGIDEVYVLLTFQGIRTDAEKTVFRLQNNFNTGRDMIGDKRGHTDAKIDVKAVLQFARNTLDDALAFVRFGAAHSDCLLRTVLRSMRRSYCSPFTMCLTKMPGVMT